MAEAPQTEHEPLTAIFEHLQALTDAVETLLIHARWQAGEVDRAMYDDFRERLEETSRHLREALNQ